MVGKVDSKVINFKENFEIFENKYMPFSKYGISNYEESILTLDEKYFYDSNYHLTMEGVELKTKIFQNQISDFLNHN